MHHMVAYEKCYPKVNSQANPGWVMSGTLQFQPKIIAATFLIVRFLTFVKVTASTMTRSTTRCSGDLMGDQIAPGDQIGDQITAVTRSLLVDQIDDQIRTAISSPGIRILNGAAALWANIRAS